MYSLTSPYLESYQVGVVDFTSTLRATVVKIYDGDTITVNIPGIHPLFGQKISVRINNIDTPELNGQCATERDLAIRAKEITSQLIPVGSAVTLKNIKRDKYFRILADIYIGSINVGQTLVESKVAVLYSGGAKPSWCSTHNGVLP